MLTRRRFLSTIPLIGLSAAGGALLRNEVANPDPLVFEQVTVPIPNLPKDLEGYRIGFLTDIHLGLYLPIEMVEQAVSTLRQAKIDLLLLGGDYLWLKNSSWTSLANFFDATSNKEFLKLPLPELRTKIFSTVADLAAQSGATDGAYAVYGNHDRWEGPSVCKKEFAEKNITLLVNEERSISRGGSVLRIAGFDDYWGGVPSISRLTEESPDTRIVLAHNPDWISYLTGKTGFDYDLAVCGHTHGGQINLPLVGSFYYNILDHRLSAGLTSIGRGMVYTSRGIGTVEIPVRINCPPEVTLLTLMGA